VSTSLATTRSAPAKIPQHTNEIYSRKLFSKCAERQIERKLRAYEAHQSQFTKFDPNRYLVLIVTTRSLFRLQHILQLASSVMRHPGRTVFVGASLSSCLDIDPFTDAIFVDHRGLKRTLVPRKS